MTDEEVLFAAIRANPEDDTPRRDDRRGGAVRREPGHTGRRHAPPRLRRLARRPPRRPGTAPDPPHRPPTEGAAGFGGRPGRVHPRGVRAGATPGSGPVAGGEGPDEGTRRPRPAALRGG